MEYERYDTGNIEYDFNSFLISSFNPSGEKFSKRSRLIRYHYTSATALKNILSETPTLRFTDIRYMNDHSEMVYCVKCLLEYLLENKQKYPFCWEVVNELLLKDCSVQEYINLSVSRVRFEDSSIFPYHPTRCFVFCMSESPDSLSMWNYYVHNGRYEGYNIGFDVYNFLKSFDTTEKMAADPAHFLYGSVLYKKSRQYKEVKSLADQIEGYRRKGEITAVDHNMVILRNYIETYGVFFKHESFSDEKEFRIVLVLNHDTVYSTHDRFLNENVKGMKLDYNERNGVLVPYMAVPINKNSVRKITISPIIEKDLAELSLRDYLFGNGYSSEIVSSAIPIRF